MAPEWRTWLAEFPFYVQLDEAEQARLHDILRVIVAEKRWEGVGGLVLEERMKVVVAAQAALLVLNLEHDYFARAKTILVYPSAWNSAYPRRHGDVVGEGAAHAGEAWYRGPVILAWDSVRHGAADPKDGRNLVFHEFAHKLDMLDGYVDGTPPLARRSAYAAWRQVMTDAFEKLREDAEKGRRTLLQKYGATNAGEFFAVATEAFFEKSLHLQRKHPDLYGLLVDYYRQDPVARLRRAAKETSEDV
jgi:Mlc titration factor MtfA (ptsG expression regulator)